MFACVSNWRFLVVDAVLCLVGLSGFCNPLCVSDRACSRRLHLRTSVPFEDSFQWRVLISPNLIRNPLSCKKEIDV